MNESAQTGALESLDLSAPRPAFGRLVARALGNVLLGIALGIGVYYFATDAISWFQQRGLKEELATLGAIASPSPDRLFPPLAQDPFDFEEWETEDVAYWDALERGGVFGRLLIERMELDVVVVKGHQRDVLKRGPGWVDYTDYPGPTGNSGISGHRTTYGAPFGRLDELEPGDTIDLYSPFRRYRYEVRTKFRVTPDRVDVLDNTAEPQLTLTACDPPYSARLRLIVQADLVEVRRLEDTDQE